MFPPILLENVDKLKSRGYLESMDAIAGRRASADV